MTCRICDSYKHIVFDVFFAVGMVQVVAVVLVVGEAVQTAKHGKTHQGHKAEAGGSCSNFYSNCPKKFGFP